MGITIDVAVEPLRTRRAALRTLWWAGLGAASVGLGLGFLRFVWPREEALSGVRYRVAPDDVPQPGDPPVYFRRGRFYLVHLRAGEGVPTSPRRPTPPGPGGLLALSDRCTHLGCQVPWRSEFWFENEPGWFRCPCHGATYTKGGVDVFGPQPRPLDTLVLTVKRNRSIDVHLKRVTLGGADNLQRVTRFQR